jgi:hypothetical protein
MYEPMITTTKRYLQTLMVVALCAASATAQEPLNKTVEVSRSYDPSLLDAYKIAIIPRISDTTRVKSTFSYLLRQVNPLTDAYLLNPIAPAKVQREKYEGSEGVNAYLRLGFGVKTTTLFDAYIGSEPSPNLLWDAYVNHYGNFGDITNAAGEKIPTSDMRNELGAAIQYNFDHATLYANAGFRQHYLRFYGYDTCFARSDYDTFADDENKSRQHFQQAYASLVYSSKNVPDSTWCFGGSFRFYDHRSRLPQSEDALRFDLYADKQVLPEFSVGMEVKTDVFLLSENLATANNTIVSLAPRISYRRDWWEATAAFDYTFDKVEGKTHSYVYPSVSIEAFLADRLFIPYVKLGGQHEANSYASLSTENPYLRPDSLLHFRNTRNIGIAGGIKGRLGSLFSYNLSAEHASLRDLSLFLNVPDSASLGAYFDVSYTNARRTRLGGELQLRPIRALEISYAVRYDIYQMDGDYPKPYNRPALAMGLHLGYNIWNKVLFSAAFNLRGGYTALDFAGNEVGRPAAGDLSLGLEYNLFKRSTVFLHLSNILNTRYQVFNSYPTYGFNALLGYACVF